jgi:hypothetical protein
VDYSIDTVDASTNGPVSLPEIVICLEAPWDVNKTIGLNMSNNLLSYMTNLIFPYAGFGSGLFDLGPDYKPTPTTLKKELDAEYTKILAETGWNVVELLDKITVSCTDFVDFCTFGTGSTSYISGAVCCKFVFLDSVYGISGKCFRTSSKFHTFFLKEAGLQSSLTIAFHVQKDVLSTLNKNITNYPAKGCDAVNIGISNKQSHLSTITPKIRGMAPNSRNYVIVRKMTVDRSERNSPFGKYHCIDENDHHAYQSFTPGYPAYTKDNCIMAQRQKFVTENYNCSLIYFNLDSETKYCDVTETTVIYTRRYIKCFPCGTKKNFELNVPKHDNFHRFDFIIFISQPGDKKKFFFQPRDPQASNPSIFLRSKLLCDRSK